MIKTLREPYQVLCRLNTFYRIVKVCLCIWMFSQILVNSLRSLIYNLIRTMGIRMLYIRID